MAKTVEELQGIHGNFVVDEVKGHPMGFPYRALATGRMTYERHINGETQSVTVPVRDISVRSLRDKDAHDLRRYVRITRGPKGNRDKIIGLIDHS